jgi:hypothetical protein
MNEINYSNVGYYSNVCGLIYDLGLGDLLNFGDIKEYLELVWILHSMYRKGEI